VPRVAVNENTHRGMTGLVLRRQDVDILSETPDPDSHPFQGYELDYWRTPTGAAARLGIKRTTNNRTSMSDAMLVTL